MRFAHGLLALLGQIERRTRRRHFGVAGEVAGGARPEPRAPGRIRRDRSSRARQPGDRLGVVGLVLQSPASRSPPRWAWSPLCAACLAIAIASSTGEGVLAPAAEPLHELLDLAFRLSADKPVHRPPVLEGIDRRDLMDPHLLLRSPGSRRCSA